ncbi:TPA: hypothetical protein RUX02_001783 [Aeromonas dhakensis]|nr:hypothetical protein [Aeromonas dhakensis]
MRLLSCMLFTLILFGCSTYSIQEKNGTSLVVWDSNLSAGVSPAAGRKMCMQLAITSEDKQTKNDVAVNDTIVTAITSLPKNPTDSELVRVKNEIIKASKALNVSTEKTSFLIAGGFYLCQLQMNGMKDEIVASLADKWLLYASSLDAQTTTKQETVEKSGGAPVTTTTTTTLLSGPAKVVTVGDDAAVPQEPVKPQEPVSPVQPVIPE